MEKIIFKLRLVELMNREGREVEREKETRDECLLKTADKSQSGRRGSSFLTMNGGRWRGRSDH